MSRRGGIAAALAALVALSGCANVTEAMESVDAGTTTEDRVGPDRWRFRSVELEQGQVSPQTLYRAAVNAKAAGYSRFHVVDYSAGALGSGAGGGLSILGTNNPDLAVACYSSKTYHYLCKAYVTDVQLAATGRTAAQIADDVVKAKDAAARSGDVR